MMRFFWLREAKEPRSTGNLNAAHRWGLPGLQCPACGATWAGSATAYPSVDLSTLPERAEFEQPRPEPFDEFVRLRELVRPLAPPGAQLLPGAEFGPLVGTASGSFGQLFMQNPWSLVMRREALEQLQTTGVRGLKGGHTELRFRRKPSPELLEMEILPQGQLHPDCLPPDRQPPCAKCGRQGLRRPEDPILDLASLPRDRDLFRLADFETTLVGTERFAEAVQRLGLDGVTFRELPAR